MFFPWIKRLGAIGLVVLGGSQASAQYGLGMPHGTNHASQYVPGTPRSPGAGNAVLNSTGRYFGFGYSEGYHQCPDGSCNTCSQTGWLHGHNVLGRIGGHGVPNIAAPSAPACNSCQNASPRKHCGHGANCGCGANCGSSHFGNYQFHAGHVFGRPSYGNPHYPTDCINWREAVKYDQGPCVPPAYYQGPAALPAPGLTYSQPAPELVPQYMPHGPQMYGPQMYGPQMNGPQMQQPISLPEPSPSDAAPGAWPWQRGGNAPQSAPAAPVAPRGLNEPTPAVPLTPVPPPPERVPAPQPPAPQPPETKAPEPKALVPAAQVPAAPAPAAPAIESLPPLVDEDEDLLGEDGSEPKLQLPGQGDKPAPVPSPPVPSPPVPAAPAPAVEPPPADEDEDLLSSRRNPIRQPKRR
jgi:hypothetical protein